MLMAGAPRDSSGRPQVTNAAGGGAAASVNQGIAISSAGRILGNTTAPGATANVNNGLARTASNGNLHVATATAGTDVFVNGFRVSAAGALVTAVEGVPAVFVNGDPFLADGSLCVTAL